MLAKNSTLNRSSRFRRLTWGDHPSITTFRICFACRGQRRQNHLLKILLPGTRIEFSPKKIGEAVCHISKRQRIICWVSMSKPTFQLQSI